MKVGVKGGGLELQGPWPTRSGILLQMSASPCTALVPQVVVPTAIPTACDHIAGMTWATCLERARADLEAKPLFAEEALRVWVSTNAWPEMCVILEIFYRLWQGGLEYWHLSRSGVPEQACKGNQGRGKIFQRRWRQNHMKNREQNNQEKAFLFWSALAQRLATYLVWPSKDLEKNFQEQAMILVTGNSSSMKMVWNGSLG